MGLGPHPSSPVRVGRVGVGVGVTSRGRDGVSSGVGGSSVGAKGQVSFLMNLSLFPNVSGTVDCLGGDRDEGPKPQVMHT